MKWSIASEESGKDEDMKENHIIPSKDLKDVLWCRNKLSTLVGDYHPVVRVVEMVLGNFNDYDGPLLESPEI